MFSQREGDSEVTFDYKLPLEALNKKYPDCRYFVRINYFTPSTKKPATVTLKLNGKEYLAEEKISNNMHHENIMELDNTVEEGTIEVFLHDSNKETYLSYNFVQFFLYQPNPTNYAVKLLAKARPVPKVACRLEVVDKKFGETLDPYPSQYGSFYKFSSVAGQDPFRYFQKQYIMWKADSDISFKYFLPEWAIKRDEGDSIKRFFVKLGYQSRNRSNEAAIRVSIDD